MLISVIITQCFTKHIVLGWKLEDFGVEKVEGCGGNLQPPPQYISTFQAKIAIQNLTNYCICTVGTVNFVTI